jgi:hypothetical protein
MQPQHHPQPVKALPRPLAVKTDPRINPVWQPQQVGLTRDELRKIVIDLIG